MTFSGEIICDDKLVFFRFCPTTKQMNYSYRNLLDKKRKAIEKTQTTREKHFLKFIYSTQKDQCETTFLCIRTLALEFSILLNIIFLLWWTQGVEAFHKWTVLFESEGVKSSARRFLFRGNFSLKFRMFVSLVQSGVSASSRFVLFLLFSFLLKIPNCLNSAEEMTILKICRWLFIIRKFEFYDSQLSINYTMI